MEYPDIIKKNWLITKDYVQLECSDEFYFRKNYSLNKYIEVLKSIFTDQGGDVSFLKKGLLDPNRRGVSLELTQIDFIGDKAHLEPSLSEDPEGEYTIDIDRKVLLELTIMWETLVKKEVPFIYIYSKDGELGVADILPEGVD